MVDKQPEIVTIDSSVGQQGLTHMSALVVHSANDLSGITKANMTRGEGNAIT